MIRFTFKYLRNRFDICIASKYTVLLGDSGTGKSFLAQMVEKFVREPKFGSCGGGYTIDVISKGLGTDALWSDAKVVVIDEDMLLDTTRGKSIIQDIKKTNKYFIIMGRSGLAEIPFGVHSIFEVSVVSDNRRKMVPAEVQSALLREATSPDPLIICEDSMSGYIAAKHVYVGSVYDVVSVGGNSNFKTMPYTSGFVVADLCGLGDNTFALARRVERNQGLQVCNIVSFEAEALKSQGVVVTEGVLNPYVGNVEKYYEDMLRKMTTPKYSKTNKDSVIALFTGFNAHEKEKLKGFKPSKGWWVPGISLHLEVLTEGEAQFLAFYRKVYGRDFTGVVPDNVKSMSYYEVYANLLAILHDLGEL